MCQINCQEWLPFDPENVPEAKKGWCLLIHDFDLDKVHALKVYDGSWRLHPMASKIEDLIKMYGAENYKNAQYKLVPLPQ